METHILERSFKSEAAARRYLYGMCNVTFQCPRCGSRMLYRLVSGRRRCRLCRYTFSDFAGRWLGLSRLSCRDWIELARLFEDEHSADEIAKAVGRAYATAYHAVTVMRACIFAHGCASDIVSQDDPLTLVRVCAHRGQKDFKLDGHVPVFGIHEFAGAVAVPPLRDLSPQIVLALPVKKVRRGRLVYTGQVEHFDALMFCVPDDFEGLSRVPFARSPTYIDGASRFWAYALPRLAAHRGVSPEHFPLYLKELEFRFNLRGEALMPLLLRYLCDFVPSVAQDAELSKQSRLDEPIRQSPGGADHV